MKYIVLTSVGKYRDDYQILKDGAMIGDVDPQMIIDTIVALESRGRWFSEKDMDASQAKEMLKAAIRRRMVPALRAAGFVSIPFKEVWLGGL